MCPRKSDASKSCVSILVVESVTTSLSDVTDTEKLPATGKPSLSVILTRFGVKERASKRTLSD